MKKILIIDDHEIVRDGLKKIVNEQSENITFGEASTAPEALRLVAEQDWDKLKQIRPGLPVLILSMHSEEQYARRAFKAGAAGYITKDSPRAELLNAINKVAEGRKYVSRALAEELVIDLERGSDRPPHETLSDREFEVMRLIASGKTVGEIAVLLSLSDNTISTYRARLLEKMKMRTNAELTHYAILNGLVG